MGEEIRSVGVIVEKRKAASQWIDHTWSVAAVLPGMPETAPMTLVERVPEGERYYLGAGHLVFNAMETANYRDNLAADVPKIWVIMREHGEDGSLSLLAVTVDPSEGEAHTQAGSDLVDAVPMSPDLVAVLTAFVDEHHVEREFFKRKRDRVDPEKSGWRKPGGGI